MQLSAQYCSPVCHAQGQSRRELRRRSFLGGGAALVPALLSTRPALAAPQVIELTPENFDSVVGSSKRAFVMLLAPWCPYCKALETDFTALPEKLAAAGTPATTVARMDVDKYTDYAQRYGVRAFPTLVLFVDGQPVGQHVGMTDAAGLLRYASARLRTDSGAEMQAVEQQEARLDLVLTDRAQSQLLEELSGLRGALASSDSGARASALKHLDLITSIVTSSSRLL